MYYLEPNPQFDSVFVSWFHTGNPDSHGNHILFYNKYFEVLIPTKGIFVRCLVDLDDFQFVDHWNRNPMDNRVFNLRICNSQQNGMNRGKSKNGRTSKYKGVYTDHRGVWVARLKKNNIEVFRGEFDTEIDAAIAYNEAAKKYHGDFAYLNEIKEEKAEPAAGI